MAEPKLTLAKAIDDMRATPMSPEFEIALQDFLELPQPEQMSILFTGLCQASHNINWCVNVLKEISK